MHLKIPYLGLILILTLLTIVGCTSDDERLAKLARESVAEQARQNERLAKQHEELSRTARQLVQADAQSREELLAATRELQSQQGDVGRQRDVLETERRELAHQRHVEPIVAGAILQVGLILGCLLPLVVCLYVLRAAATGADDQRAISEVLIEQVVVENSLAPHDRLSDGETVRLPAPQPRSSDSD